MLPGTAPAGVSGMWKVLETSRCAQQNFPSLYNMPSKQKRNSTPPSKTANTATSSNLHKAQQWWQHRKPTEKLESPTWSASGMGKVHWEAATQTPSKVIIRKNVQKLPAGELPTWSVGCWVLCRYWGLQANRQGLSYSHEGEQRHLQSWSLGSCHTQTPLLGSSTQLCLALLTKPSQEESLKMLTWLPNKDRSPPHTPL